MGRLNLTNDEASLLKTYKLSTLSPKRWEDIDHDALDSVAGRLTNPQGDVDIDPLGLRSSFAGSLDKLDLETKASILISSKSFDPKAFLSYAYPNATPQDLTIGVSNLGRAIDSRAEAIKILVEENIDRFVTVKASSDAVFAEMKEGLLADDTEFASKTLREKLKQASMKADQVFLPVLENASKANKVRSTLGVFERSKFFFNLPGSLMEAIQEGKYEAALRDYKKGKYVMSRPNQLLPNIPVNETGNDGKQLELQQKRIFDKLWASIEKVMGVMRTELLKKLKEPGRPVEEQEKILEVLLDLGSTNGDDPVWIFFDNQHNHITTLMKAAHKTQLIRYEDAKRNVPPDAISSDPVVQHAYIAGHLKTCLSAIGTPLADNIIAKAPGSEAWQTIVDLVHNVSEVMLANLPSFWKIGKSYIDGKFRKDTSSRRSPTQVRTMTADIIKTYITLLSDFFVLSDMAVAFSPPDATSAEPKFLPPGCNSLTTGFYLGRIFQEINDCVTELLATDMSGDSSTVLKELLDNARWKFLDVLSYTWTRDMRLFHHLENWEINSQVLGTTLYILKMQTLQKHNISLSYRLAGGNDPFVTTKGSSKKTIRPEFASKIIKAFLDALYGFLDGLVHLASDDWKLSSVASDLIKMTRHEASSNNLDLDLTSTHTRLLLVLSNLNYLKETVVPQMLSQMENGLGFSTEEDQKALERVLSEVDQTLFEDYVKQKASVVNRIMQGGILDPSINWFETPPPTEVRAFVFEVLMSLVEVHAHVSNVAKPLLERILRTLIEDLVEYSLGCFKQIKRFGMGGMLRATLEIEFMHQVLFQYVTPKATAQLNEIYQKISESYSHRPGDENLQTALTEVKKTLNDTRKATGIEFLCFRAPSRKSEGHHVHKRR